MRILEEFIESKTGNLNTCEDGLYYNDDFVAIIDGCTNKTIVDYKETPGIIAKNLIIEAISKLPKEIKAYQAFDKLSQNITSWYKENQLLEKVSENPELRVSACALIYSKYYHQLWFVGDCQALINDKKLIHFPTLIEHYTSNIRAFLIQAELQKGNTTKALLENDITREKLIPILSQQVYLQNELGIGAFAYSVINGFPIRKEDIKIIQLSKDQTTICLSSDGYPKIKKSLEKSEKYLKKIINEDPLLFTKYKATKGVMNNQVSFDDRSYIKFTVSE